MTKDNGPHYTLVWKGHNCSDDVRATRIDDVPLADPQTITFMIQRIIII
jgi:hypothetical protein